ncbi:cytoplasmic protein [Allomesorhizobium camelthorni]|uniref:cytoplasmic protein n=1 Tax=Allomesorhizobium camelthorni TaxID=475069 RepID=UPI001FE40C51|nr:cytoplasmic protein [Mesorhizobium camelthorni]
MHGFRQETKDFKDRKAQETAHARQIAALHLACGIDLAAALQAGPAEKLRLAGRLERAIERERLKGLRRHWSYDLNRHIALKQGLDRLRGTEAAPRQGMAGKQNGARRRRRETPVDV